jgi:poly(A) polymerase
VLYRYTTNTGGTPLQKAVVYTKKEHSIDPEKVDNDAKRIVKSLQQFGHDAYIVGGAVRDLLLGKSPKDFDIVTDATPARIKKLFRTAQIIGKRFRLVHIHSGEKIFEVSTFRSLEDGTVGNRYGAMDDDALRRDFSLNALYYDPLNECVIDYVGGIRDISKRCIVPVIPLATIFSEDPVRIIRAIKYAAMTGFNLPFALRRQIRQDAWRLQEISPSRITEELFKIIDSGHSADIVSSAIKQDIYRYLQPEAASRLAENTAFARQYLAHLKKMDIVYKLSPKTQRGEKLTFMLVDYFSLLADWGQEYADGKSGTELYLQAWTGCRNFIRPMNPPCKEFDVAVRSMLKQFGVTVTGEGFVRRPRHRAKPDNLSQVLVSGQ